MMNYWNNRILDQQETLFNKTQGQIDGALRSYYKRALRETQQDISTLYDQLVKEAQDGKIKPNDLYRYNRLFAIKNNLNRRLNRLGQNENTALRKFFSLIYKETDKEIRDWLIYLGLPVERNSFNLQQEKSAENVINSVWCADGKHWSDRLWRDKEVLQNKIETGLFDSISRGIAKDELVKELDNCFSAGFNSSDRIARTELTYVQNQAAKDRYIEAGIERYKFLAEIDSRTSTICRELNGKIFEFSQSVVGENMPPCHPNCRSTIVPVVEGLND